MSLDNNKIEDIDYANSELDSNQIAESLQNNERYLDHLISVVRMMLDDKESKLDNKSSAQKVNFMLKKLLNVLSQAHSFNLHENTNKYLTRIRGLKAEFTRFVSHSGMIASYCLCAIKILEALASHITARKEAMSSYKDTISKEFFNLERVNGPMETIVFPVYRGTSPDSSGQVHTYVHMILVGVLIP